MPLCTLAIWHHPRFSSGEHGNDPTVAPFWDALHAAGADVIVNGHDHDYERFAPQDPDGVARSDAAGSASSSSGRAAPSSAAFGTQAANSELRAAGVLRGPAARPARRESTSGRSSRRRAPVLDAGNTNCH